MHLHGTLQPGVFTLHSGTAGSYQNANVSLSFIGSAATWTLSVHLVLHGKFLVCAVLLPTMNPYLVFYSEFGRPATFAGCRSIRDEHQNPWVSRILNVMKAHVLGMKAALRIHKSPCYQTVWIIDHCRNAPRSRFRAPFLGSPVKSNGSARAKALLRRFGHLSWSAFIPILKYHAHE